MRSMNGTGRVTFLSALLGIGLAAPAFTEPPVGSPGSARARSQAALPSDSSATPDPKPEWGTTDWVLLVVGMMGFSQLQDGQWNHYSDGWSYRSGGANGGTCVGLHLPSGALLSAITTYTNDTNASDDIQYILYKQDLVTNTGTMIFNWSTSGTPGIQRQARQLAAAETIDNYNTAYELCIYHGATGPTLQSGGATLWYKLQVSPAPATATFADVPTSSPFSQYVEALYAAGLIAGCGGGNYCPTNPVTRGQMAVFLARAFGMHWPY